MSLSNTLGRVVRLPFKLIPPGSVIPILIGPTRGLRWIVGSDIHRTWLGFYERRKLELFKERIKPGDVFFDIGAHVGIYSALAARAGATVFAFEPLERNISYLHRHVEINNLRVTVLDVAVSDKTGLTMFDEGCHNKVGAISESGKTQVKTVKLDDLQLSQPTIIKMDIEGGEVSALKGMPRILSRKPVVFLATHGESIKKESMQILSDHGYTFLHLDDRELIAS